MKSPTLALLWEAWRASRFELLTRASIHSVPILFVARGIGFDVSQPAIQATAGILMLLWMMGAVFSAAWMGQFDDRQSGFSFRLGFTRPVATWRLVLVPMAFVIVSSTLCYVIPATLFRLLVGPIAILAPTTLIATLVAGCTAATWSPATRMWKSVSLFILGAAWSGILAWGMFPLGDETEPMIIKLAQPEFFYLSWLQYIGLFAATGAANFVTVWAVDRQRHTWGRVNAQWGFDPVADLSKTNSRERTVRFGRSFPFRGAVMTQCWFELRRSGFQSLLVGCSIPVLTVLLLVVTRWLDPSRDDAAGAWVVAILASPLVSQLLGADATSGLRHRQGTVDLSPFDATRPLRNDQLVTAKLLAITGSSILVVICVAACGVVYTLLIGEIEPWRQMGAKLFEAGCAISPLAWFVGTAGFVAFLVSGTSMLLVIAYWLPAHRGLAVGLTVFASINVLVAIWDHKNGWQFWSAWQVYGHFASATLVALCIFAISRAIASGSVGCWYMAAVGVNWFVCLAAICWLVGFANLPFDRTWESYLGALYVLVVPLAGYACAPLAIGGFRHR